MAESPSSAFARDILDLKKAATRAEASGDLEKALSLTKEIVRLHESGSWTSRAADAGRMKAIGEIGRRLLSSLSLDGVFDVLYAQINKVLDAPVFAIALREEDKDILRYSFIMEAGQKIVPEEIPLDAADSLGARCAREGREIIFNDLSLETGDMPGAPRLHHMGRPELRVHSAACFPLAVNDRVMGVMSAQSFVRSAYGPDELDTLRSLASYLSIALENARLYREVSDLAITDSLTGILNRRELFRRGESEFSRHDRYEGGVSVILSDLDNFKRVNDEYGHAAGDTVLKAAAARLGSQLREPDILGRYGGEEFLIILPNTDSQGALVIAERIRESLMSEPIKTGKQDDAALLTVTASFGIAGYDDDIPRFDVLVARADEALYRAKSLGRNRSEVVEKGVYHEE